MDAVQDGCGCRGYMHDAGGHRARCPETCARLTDRWGFVAGLSGGNSGGHREVGELWDALNFVGTRSLVDCCRTWDRRGARVDQIGVRTVFERVRGMP